jgi:SAM-dependent methyltransferase
MELTELLQCPACHGALRQQGAALECQGCDRTYPVVDRIPCFAETNPFYDRYAEEECPYSTTPKGPEALILKLLPFWSYREWRFWRAVVPEGGRLLDIGCGRGKEVFVEKADTVVGLDGSIVFLRDCLSHYDASILGTLPRLPFRDGTFDTVVSSHVLGHVAIEDKDVLVGEMARVLRKGGIAAHIIETDSLHPAITAAKASPEAYRRWIIEQDGHIGLELADRVIERFTRQGFRLRTLRFVDAIVPSVMYYRKCLGHPEFAHLPGLFWTRALQRLNAATRIGNLAYEFGLGTFHRTFEQWLGDRDCANFIHAAFEKN